MAADQAGMTEAVPVLQRLTQALENVREALRHTDLEAAALALASHDALLRETLAEGRLAASEGEWLLANQRRLLADLEAIRAGVRAQSADLGRSAGAARAYLDTHGSR